MFCRNCGNPMHHNQAICLRCGVKKGVGRSFCANCGSPVAPNAAVCVRCGVSARGGLGSNDKLTIALLCFFLGGIGIHNFVMGENKKGVFKIIMAFFCGLSGLFALIDFIKILLDKYEVNPDALI